MTGLELVFLLSLLFPCSLGAAGIAAHIWNRKLEQDWKREQNRIKECYRL